jgi:hypothetical protein
MNIRTTARRELLRRSDELIEVVEQLRMSDQPGVSSGIRDALAVLADEVYGRGSNRQIPTTAKGAHRFLFSLQGRLLRAPVQTQRQRIVTSRGGREEAVETWKEIELPGGDHHSEWRELAGLTAQRALDRFDFVRGQAVHEARRGRRQNAAGLWRKAEAAWANYWRLAEQLRETDS